MITETIKNNNQNEHVHLIGFRNLRIVKETSHHLLLTDGYSQMIFKTFPFELTSSLPHLQRRMQLKHESLLHIHKI